MCKLYIIFFCDDLLLIFILYIYVFWCHFYFRCLIYLKLPQLSHINYYRNSIASFLNYTITFVQTIFIFLKNLKYIVKVYYHFLCLHSFRFHSSPSAFDRIFLQLLPDGTAFMDMSTKWFQNLVVDPLGTIPATSSVVSANSYTNFWRSPIPHCARTVLWRTFHSKLPCRCRLYRFDSTTFPDLFCPLCGGVNTDEHILWSRPLKRPLWLKLAYRCFLQPTFLDYKHILLPVASELKVLPQFSFDGQALAACAVWSLWRIYWKLIFNDTAFWSDEAAARATCILRKIDLEVV